MKENPDITKTPLSLDAAARHIWGLLQRAMQGGSVDSERDSLNDILYQLNSGKISPEEAVRRAEQISSSRQDYH